MDVINGIIGRDTEASKVRRLGPNVVHEDPYRDDIRVLWEKWKKDMRVLYSKDGSEWFVWQSDLDTHLDVARKMGLDIRDYFAIQFNDEPVYGSFSVGCYRTEETGVTYRDTDRLVNRDSNFRFLFKDLIDCFEEYTYCNWDTHSGYVRKVVKGEREAVASSVRKLDLSDQFGDAVRVFENPLGSEVCVLYNKMRGYMRGLYAEDGSEWFIWDAGVAIHRDVLDRLGLNPDKYYALHFDLSGREFGLSHEGRRSGLTPECVDDLVNQDRRFRDIFGDCLQDYRQCVYVRSNGRKSVFGRLALN